MNGRFTSARRLRLMSGVIGLAEDRDGIGITEAAAELGVEPQRIEECLRPLADLEYTRGSRFLEDLGTAVSIDDGVIRVHTNWWRDMGTVTPGEAARLYVAIVHAMGVLPRDDWIDLVRLERRLASMVAVGVIEPVPDQVRTLLDAQRSRELVRARILGEASSLLPPPRDWEVYRVARRGPSWEVTVAPHDVPDAPATTVYLQAIDELETTGRSFVPRTGLQVADLDAEGGIVAVIEHDPDVAWKLELSEVERETIRDGRYRSTVAVPNLRSLRNLLLRLGPKGRLIGPAEYAGLQRRVAGEVLGRYGVKLSDRHPTMDR